MFKPPYAVKKRESLRTKFDGFRLRSKPDHLNATQALRMVEILSHGDIFDWTSGIGRWGHQLYADFKRDMLNWAAKRDCAEAFSSDALQQFWNDFCAAEPVGRRPSIVATGSNTRRLARARTDETSLTTR